MSEWEGGGRPSCNALLSLSGWKEVRRLADEGGKDE